MDLKGKKVAVVGLAKSGLAAARLLLKCGAEARITENADTEDVRKNIERLLPHCADPRERLYGDDFKAPVAINGNIRLQIGGHTEEFIQGCDFVVTSPGVSGASLPLQTARGLGIPVISEIELASRFCRAPIVAVTGTSGKTTVTTLIGMILKAAAKKVFVCGNIGKPFCDIVEDVTADDIVVLEVSSFQLASSVNFKPHIAVLLNISSNHLDRHRDFNEYAQAKAKIFLNQDSGDWAVLNIDDPVVESLADGVKANVRWFGMEPDPNLEAARTVGDIFNIPSEVMDKALMEFKGIEHRLEDVDTINGVRFINDSKSTTPASLIWALRSINQPIVLIAGGRDKDMDFSSLKEVMGEFKIDGLALKVKHTILIGEIKEKIRSSLDNIVPVREADSLKEAVHYAISIASAGDCVLLSPACASFDMFKNYEHRGETFKKIVKELKTIKKKEYAASQA